MDSANFRTESATQRLRCPPLHDARHLKVFQEDFEHFLGGIQIEPLHGHPLAMETTVSQFEGMSILIGETSPSLCTHPVSSGSDDSVVLLGLYQGQGTMSARGSDWSMNGGDMVFSGSHDLRSVVTYTAAQLCLISLSRSLLTSMQVDADAAMHRPLRGHSVVAMLMRYAYLLRDQGDVATPELRRAASLHLHDRAIQTLAFDAGFGDLSYFNRSFRQRYGMSPSEVRAGEGRI